MSSHRDIAPKPFIPKRPPPAQSVYSPEDYDENGKLVNLKKVPLGDQFQQNVNRTGAGTSLTSTNPVQNRGTSTSTSTPSGPVEPLPTSAPYQAMPGKTDKVAPPAVKHRIGKNKFDVRTPKSMCDPEEQYIAVIRTVENRHPDEDRILQHYALQYVARQQGTYDPIQDPPVVLSDLVPTCVVVIDRVFSRDEVGSENKTVSKYVEKMALQHTDFDVVPVYMNKPVQIPLHASTCFKYKDPVMDQIMTEFYKSRDESASELMDRIEADRNGEAPKPTPWHVYDGVSEQGAFGPKSVVKTIAQEVHPRPENDNQADVLNPELTEQFKDELRAKGVKVPDTPTTSWADMVEKEEEEEEDEPEGGWQTVAPKKGKMKASGPMRGGARRPVRKA